MPEGGVRGVAFSPDGKTLAAGYISVATRSGGVVLWDVATRTRLVKEPLAVPEGGVRGVAFSPDGKALAAGYARIVCESSGVVLWDVAAHAAGRGAPSRARGGGWGAGLQPRRQDPGRCLHLR